MNHEIPDVQAGFRKGRETRDKIANIYWIIKKAREFQKNIYFCFIDYARAFNCVNHNKLWKILKEMQISDHLTYLLGICMEVKKQKLERDMEQQTGSKLGKEELDFPLGIYIVRRKGGRRNTSWNQDCLEKYW